MQDDAKDIDGYSLTGVLFQAIQGLNLVELYLKEAERHNDPAAVRWLKETKKGYQQILGSAQEFVRNRSSTSVM